MRPLLVYLLLLLPAPLLLAQTGVMTQTTRDRINFSGLSIPATGVIYGVEGEAGKMIGDAYYDTTFQAGNVRFYGRIGAADSLAGVPIRYDLYAQEVEFRAGANDIRAAKAASVLRFAINDRLGSTTRFVNVREFRGEADELVGFFEQVVPGKLQLLQYHSITIKKASFNVALNVGSKDDVMVKKHDWYVAKGNRAQKFSASKKSLLELMANQQSAIEAFLKDKKPDLKRPSGVAAVFDYYASL
jgi:hypothetical protein